MHRLTDAQVRAIMGAMLKVTGASNPIELSKLSITKEQWRKAYEFAGVPWSGHNEIQDDGP